MMPWNFPPETLFIISIKKICHDIRQIFNLVLNPQFFVHRSSMRRGFWPRDLKARLHKKILMSSEMLGLTRSVPGSDCFFFSSDSELFVHRIRKRISNFVDRIFTNFVTNSQFYVDFFFLLQTHLIGKKS